MNMLPSTNAATLARYLSSASRAIEKEIASEADDGLNLARLAEASAIIARVAQQLADDRDAAENARTELAALTAAEAEFRANIGPPIELAGSRQIDAGRVETFLRGHAQGGEATRILQARLLAGGRCKVTALVRQEGAADLPPSLILRQDWDGGATETSVVGEYALLKCLYDQGVRVPRPLLLEEGSDALGSPFLLVEEVEGSVNGGLYEPPASAGLMRQLAEQLGLIHAIPLDLVEPLLPDAPRQTGDDPADIEAFAETHAQIGLQSRIIDEAIEWLRAHIGDAGDALCLIHNDFGFHNVLTRGDRLTAVLDWELATIGNPASDLGYVMHFVQRVMPWEDFLRCYREAGGADLSPETIRYHAVWNAVRLYGLIMQARHNLELGRVSDIEITYACADNVMRLIAFVGEQILEDAASDAVVEAL